MSQTPSIETPPHEQKSALEETASLLNFLAMRPIETRPQLLETEKRFYPTELHPYVLALKHTTDRRSTAWVSAPRLSVFFDIAPLQPLQEAPLLKQLTDTQGMTSPRHPAFPWYDSCQRLGADLRVYDLCVPADSETALSQDNMLHAISYGMMAVDPGLSCLVLDLPQQRSDTESLPAALAPDLSSEVAARTSLAALLNDWGQHAGRAALASFGALMAAQLASIPVLTTSPTAKNLKPVLAYLPTPSLTDMDAPLAHILAQLTSLRSLTAWDPSNRE